MRLHVYLDDELVAELDRVAGQRGRSSYIEQAVRQKLDEQRRWEKIRAAYGTIADEGHDWDSDVARWVHEQRRTDPRRVG
jgi:metal-responsive CopG/Arc/MetJ family transcriptional regulator